MSSNQPAGLASGNSVVPTDSAQQGVSPIREEHVQNAVRFLNNPSVRSASDEQKRQFLVQKGLLEHEISAAFNSARREAATPGLGTDAPPIGVEAQRTGAQPSYASQPYNSFPPPVPRPMYQPTMYHAPPPPMQSSYGFPRGPAKPDERSWAWRVVRSWVIPVAVSAGIVAIGTAIYNRYLVSPEPAEKTNTSPDNASISTRRVTSPESYEDNGARQRRSRREKGARRRHARSTPHKSDHEDSDTSRFQESAHVTQEIQHLRMEMMRLDQALSDKLTLKLNELGENHRKDLDYLAKLISTQNQRDDYSRSGLTIRDPPGGYAHDESLARTVGSAHSSNNRNTVGLNALTNYDQRVGGVGERSVGSSRGNVDASKIGEELRLLVNRCIEDKVDLDKPLGTLLLVTKNILNNPSEPLYRRVNTSSPRFTEWFSSNQAKGPGSMFAVLEAAGFERKGNIYTYESTDLSRIEALSRDTESLLSLHFDSERGAQSSSSSSSSSYSESNRRLSTSDSRGMNYMVSTGIENNRNFKTGVADNVGAGIESRRLSSTSAPTNESDGDMGLNRADMINKTSCSDGGARMNIQNRNCLTPAPTDASTGTTMMNSLSSSSSSSQQSPKSTPSPWMSAAASKVMSSAPLENQRPTRDLS
eukprot:Selendium_serpulae@DN4408_c0_g1_i2.p1